MGLCARGCSVHHRACALTAVHHEVRPCAVAALAARKEKRRVGDLTRVPDAAEHDVLDFERFPLIVGPALLLAPRLRG